MRIIIPWGDVPDAGDIDYDPTGCEVITATKVQGALVEVDTELDSLSNSLTQLPDTFSYGNTEVINVTEGGSYTAPSLGLITGYFRKSNNTNLANVFITSDKLTSNDKYRFLYTTQALQGYIPINLVVTKGEKLTFTSLSEINLSNSVVKFMPLKSL